MDLVDWVKMVWIVMDNDLSITKPIKIYNKQKFKSMMAPKKLFIPNLKEMWSLKMSTLIMRLVEKS